MPSARWSKHLAWAWAGLILLLTLFPGPEITPSPENVPSILCIICGERGSADGILNVLLFLPLGAALMAATGNTTRVMALGVTLSIAIEMAQGMIPGRYQALGDVLYNTIGVGAGVGLAAIAKPLLWPSPPLARALTVGTGVGAGALLFVAGVLLVPSFPSTIYYGQWTADLHYMEAYEGRVLEASLGSMFLASERTSDPELAVNLLRSGAPLYGRAVAGPAPPWPRS